MLLLTPIHAEEHITVNPGEIVSLVPDEEEQEAIVEKEPVVVQEERSVLMPMAEFPTEEELDNAYDKFRHWYNTMLYLLGAAGTGILGFLGRFGYILYQTKTGKLIVKHIKNELVDLEEDILDTIDKIVDLDKDDGDDAKKRLEDIKQKIDDVIKEKLPTPPPIKRRNQYVTD